MAATGWQDSERALVLESGVDVPFLASLLRDSRSSMVLQVAALLAADMLIASPEAAVTALAEGVVPPLVLLLRSGDTTLHGPAAICQHHLLCCSAETGPALVAACGVPLLTRLLASPTAWVQSTAAGALRILASTPEQQEAIVTAHAVPALVPLLGSTAKDVQHAAVTALHTLAASAGRAETLQAFIAAAAIPALVGLLRSGMTSAAREAAASALNNLAATSSEGAAAVAAAGGVAVLQAALEGEAATGDLKEAASLALDLLRTASG